MRLAVPLQNRLVYVEPPPPFKADSDTVLVCKGHSPEQVLSLAIDGRARQIVQEECHLFESEVQSSIQMIDSPKTFFDYPLSSILAPDRVSAQMELQLSQVRFPFYRSVDKCEILALLYEHLRKGIASKSLCDELRLAADELFTNALYNAAAAQLGGIVDRRADVEIHPDKASQISLGAHDGRLALVCTDAFGTLNITRLLHKIRNCYTFGITETINWGPGGAGIGSFMVFDSASSMYYAVERGKRTVVGCLIPLDKALRAAGRQKKSLHFFES